MKSTILFICVAAASTSLTLSAGIPAAISYQGRILDTSGDPVVDGLYSVTFTIYDAPTAGNSKWTETQSSVTVINGLFNVELGSVTPLDDSVFSIPERYLGIQIGADSGVYFNSIKGLKARGKRTSNGFTVLMSRPIYYLHNNC